MCYSILLSLLLPQGRQSYHIISPEGQYIGLFILHNVTAPGVLKIKQATPPPGGLLTGPSPYYYNFRFLGSFEGSFELCLYVRPSSLLQGKPLQLLSRRMRGSGGRRRKKWQDITTLTNSRSGFICGLHSEMSKYTLAYA